jgi:hypothetical protein
MLLSFGYSLLTQNDYIHSEVLINDQAEHIFYDIYQTGLDNYRFEFKSVTNADTTHLFNCNLNDSVYGSMKFDRFVEKDMIKIVTNIPVEPEMAKTEKGKVVVLTSNSVLP